MLLLAYVRLFCALAAYPRSSAVFAFKVLYSYGGIEVCDWFCCRATILGLAHNIEKGNRVRKEGAAAMEPLDIFQIDESSGVPI